MLIPAATFDRQFRVALHLAGQDYTYDYEHDYVRG